MSIDPHRDLYGTGLRIAVFEYLCSSGAYQDSGPSGPYAELINEGAAMLLALCDDLAGCQQTVCIALEPTLQAAWEHQAHRRSILKKIKTHGITNGPDPSIQRVAQQWTTIAQGCDCAIVIAPELRLLWQIILSMRNQGCKIVAPSDEFIRYASDKWETYRRWQTNQLLTIPSALASDWIVDPNRMNSSELDSDGWVLKRRFTAGGTDMQRFSSSLQLQQAVSELQAPCDWIVQPWVLGTPASLAVVGPLDRNTQQPLVIGPCAQLFEPSTGCYVGGYGPLQADSQRPETFAKSLLHTFADEATTDRNDAMMIDGWVGIDFLILSDNRWIPLEINARLTSSYLGYRKQFGPLLANSILGNPLPLEPKSDSSNPAVFRFSVRDFHG